MLTATLLKNRRWLQGALAMAFAALTPPVLAEGSSAVSDESAAPGLMFDAGDANGQSFLPAPLSSEQLGSASGRQGVPMQLQLNNNEQDAQVSDNILSGNVITGTNSISDNAFQNMSGIATVIQNTGNQVVIQGSTMINILINQ
jgi:hypothetical protein